jgi:spore germination protein YaaH
LISNFEDSSIDTASALNRVSSRDNLVDQTIAAAIASGVDGINVDFEQIGDTDKDGYLEFIKELSLKCKKNDLILSVDNYVPTAASAHYNRSVQADYADYVVTMAYDEHYAGSKKAGSVSSYPFVKNGVENSLKEVPKEQLVLALPFFTRIWCTEGDNVTSEAVGMKNQYEKFGQNGGEAKWLSKEGQNYGEYKSGDKLYQCWFEDSKSLGKKMELVNTEKLAGVAFWKLGLESDDAWVTVLNYFAEK